MHEDNLRRHRAGTGTRSPSQRLNHLTVPDATVAIPLLLPSGNAGEGRTPVRSPRILSKRDHSSSFLYNLVRPVTVHPARHNGCSATPQHRAGLAVLDGPATLRTAPPLSSVRRWPSPERLGAASASGSGGPKLSSVRGHIRGPEQPAERRRQARRAVAAPPAPHRPSSPASMAEFARRARSKIPAVARRVEVVVERETEPGFDRRTGSRSAPAPTPIDHVAPVASRIGRAKKRRARGCRGAPAPPRVGDGGGR